MAGQKVIDGWRHAWRLHTVKFGAALLLVPEFLVRVSETLGAILPAIPQEIKEYLPENVRVALALAGLVTMFLRLWRQKNVDKYFERRE